MNKKFLLFFLAIFIAILYLFSIEKFISKEIASISNLVKSKSINIVISISEAVDKYLNQLDYIDQLIKVNEQNSHYKLLYEKNLSALEELNKNININIKNNENYIKTRVISYYKFNDYSKVILDKNINNINNSISALITYDGFSAGIILKKENQSIAYLNQNRKCNYTVYIGKNKTPGITSGIADNGNILIKYVPIWKSVSIGDEVITSSMDSIFPYGIKVGIVTKINIYENIKEILVSPYANTLGNRDYYVFNINN
jgi:rod shape-determining protein MreC